ncbi:hypothetical protein V8D89_009326 [Ganoderma adspersum]
MCGCFTPWACAVLSGPRLAVISVGLKLGVDKHTLRYAADALRENPVPKLLLALEYEEDFGLCGQLFSQELAETLTHLRLFVKYKYTNLYCPIGADGRIEERIRHHWHEIRGQWDDLLNKMTFVLRPLRKPTHLFISIHSYVLLLRPIPPNPIMPPNPEWALKFDFKGTAVSLVPQFPSLRYLFFSTSGNHTGSVDHFYNWKTNEAWHAVRSFRIAEPGTDVGGTQLEGEQRSLVELRSNDVVEAILEREELNWTSRTGEENASFEMVMAGRIPMVPSMHAQG